MSVYSSSHVITHCFFVIVIASWKGCFTVYVCMLLKKAQYIQYVKLGARHWLSKDFESFKTFTLSDLYILLHNEWREATRLWNVCVRLRMRSHGGPIPECTLCVKFSSIEHLLKTHFVSVCVLPALSFSHSSEPEMVSASPLPTLTLKAEQEEGQHPLRRFFPSWYVPLSIPPTTSHTWDNVQAQVW